MLTKLLIWISVIVVLTILGEVISKLVDKYSDHSGSTCGPSFRRRLGINQKYRDNR